MFTVRAKGKAQGLSCKRCSSFVCGVEFGSRYSRASLLNAESKKLHALSEIVPGDVVVTECEKPTTVLRVRNLIGSPSSTIHLKKEIILNGVTSPKTYDLKLRENIPVVTIGDKDFLPNDLVANFFTNLKNVLVEFVQSQNSDTSLRQINGTNMETTPVTNMETTPPTNMETAATTNMETTPATNMETTSETNMETATNKVQVCITIPPDFDLEQRRAVVRAAEQAGLDVLQLVEEPIAALYAASIVESNGNFIVANFSDSCSDEDILSLSLALVNVTEGVPTTVTHTCLGGTLEDIIAQSLEAENLLSRAFKSLAFKNSQEKRAIEFARNEGVREALENMVTFSENSPSEKSPEIKPTQIYKKTINPTKLLRKAKGQSKQTVAEYLYRCLDNFLALALEQDFNTQLILVGTPPKLGSKINVPALSKFNVDPATSSSLFNISNFLASSCSMESAVSSGAAIVAMRENRGESNNEVKKLGFQSNMLSSYRLFSRGAVLARSRSSQFLPFPTALDFRHVAESEYFPVLLPKVRM